MLAIRNSIPTKPIALPLYLEIVAVELIHTRYVVCATYLPPNMDISKLTDTISVLSKLSYNHSIIVIGDFQFPRYKLVPTIR